MTGDVPPLRDSAMLELAERLNTFDSVRVNVMVDLMRTTIKGAEPPLDEAMWALVKVLVALIMAHPDKTARELSLSQAYRMIALAAGWGERQWKQNADDAKIKVH